MNGMDYVWALEVTLNGDIIGDQNQFIGFEGYPDVASGHAGDFLVAFQGLVFGGDNEIWAWLWGNRLYLPLVIRNAR